MLVKLALAVITPCLAIPKSSAEMEPLVMAMVPSAVTVLTSSLLDYLTGQDPFMVCHGGSQLVVFGGIAGRVTL